MSIKADLKALVQALCASARALKVEPVRDQAARKKVEGMMALIRKVKGRSEKNKEAEEVYERYFALRRYESLPTTVRHRSSINHQRFN